MSNSDNEENDMSLGDMFVEPPRAPSPEPTFAHYARERLDTSDWRTVEIRLVGSHPLWGHYLWNASLAFASYLDEHPDIYCGQNVLELGAGGALPGIVTAKNGAKKVVLTDYPDRALIDNISFNVSHNLSSSEQSRVSVEGYIWGHAVEPLLQKLSDNGIHHAFDLVILSDLVFNHSQHDAMLNTCENALAKSDTASVLVFFTHHRPHLADRDMEFFAKARQRGWLCEEIVSRKYPPMFPNDSGSEEVRSTVHGWRLVHT